MSNLLDKLGVQHPIFLAPLGGGPSTPELAAAVTNAGGLGSIACAYLTPEQIAAAVARFRQLSDGPVHLNLFAGGWNTTPAGDVAPMLQILADAHAELGLAPPAVPTLGPDPFPQQFEAVLDARPALFSFTFGIPSVEAIARAKARGILVAGTATTLDEAKLLEQAGADAVIAQGGEAGGHRGTFAAAFEKALVPTLELVESIARTCRLPILASGGIMDGAAIAAALARGATAAQLGTAFLACPEAGTSAPYRQALLAARSDTTVLTRAFSGRPARGLANAFTRRLANQPGIIPPYPLQNALTRPMRTAAARQGKAEYLSLWAGQGVAAIRPLPAAELVRLLLEELRHLQAK